MFLLKTIGYDSSQMFYIPQVLKINCFFLHTRDGDYQGETWQKFVENDLVYKQGLLSGTGW